MDDKYKRLYESLCKAHIALENRNAGLLIENEFLKTSLDNADKAINIIKMNMLNAITDNNSKEQDYIKIVQGLRAKLKELGYGDIG